MSRKKVTNGVSALKKEIKQAETHTAFVEKAKQSQKIYLFLIVLIVAVVALITFLVQEQMNEVTGNAIMAVAYQKGVYNPNLNNKETPVFTPSQACYLKARQAAQQLVTRVQGLDIINTDLVAACQEHTFGDRSTQRFCDTFLASYNTCATEQQQNFETSYYFLEKNDRNDILIVK